LEEIAIMKSVLNWSVHLHEFYWIFSSIPSYFSRAKIWFRAIFKSGNFFWVGSTRRPRPPYAALALVVRRRLPPGTHTGHHSHAAPGVTLFLRCCPEPTGFLLHSDRLPTSSASAVRLGVQLSWPRFFSRCRAPRQSLRRGRSHSSLSPSLHRFDAEPELRFPAVRRSPRLPPSRAGVAPSPVRAPSRVLSEASSQPGRPLTSHAPELTVCRAAVVR
jgi:hypothetical protein